MKIISIKDTIVRYTVLLAWLSLCSFPISTLAIDTDMDGIDNTVDPDDDNDFMPDTHEIRIGFDPLSPFDAEVDSDSDDHNNESEFRAGTDPLDANDNPDNANPLHYKFLTHESSGRFGESVAIEGNTAIVGASYDRTVAFRAGAVYVLSKNDNGVWNQSAKLTTNDGSSYDFFGSSVAISGDTVVVSSIHDNSWAGSVYVFVRSTDGSWSQEAKLVPTDSRSGDTFGDSISISGDTILIGASGDGDNGFRSGSAYIYERDSNSNWIQIAKILPNDGAEYDYFGDSVSLDGDTAIIGASNDRHTGTMRGSAYIFTRDAQGQWLQHTKLIGPNVDLWPSGSFGFSVVLHDNITVVGAPGVTDPNHPGHKSGTAYIFKQDQHGAWHRYQELSSPILGHGFGGSVAIEEQRIFVNQGSGGSNSGYGFIFERNAGSNNWDLAAFLRPQDRSWNHQFGKSIAFSVDQAVIGSPNDDDNGNETGSVYFFDLSDPDNDGIMHTVDNCRELPNPDQLDSDGDSEGDICDGDGDNDGDEVINDLDLCPDSPAEHKVDQDGCTASQLVARLCPVGNFSLHGQYVSCVTSAANEAVDKDLISPNQKSQYIRDAANKHN